MKDNPVAGLNRLIDRGRSLFVKGMDVRTLTAGIEWQGHADQFKQEAKAWVKEQSPDDAVRLETLSPYPAVGLPPGHPWGTSTPVLGIIASCTSSAICEENNPVSYHLALVNELKEIVSDWRVKSPEKAPEPFTLSGDVEEGYSEHVKITRGVKGRAPTEAEDIAWGRGHNLGRKRVMGLRKNSPDRTAKDRRQGNRPKK